jgi:hypothetical protein
MMSVGVLPRHGMSAHQIRSTGLVEPVTLSWLAHPGKLPTNRKRLIVSRI